MLTLSGSLLNVTKLICLTIGKKISGMPLRVGS